MHYLISITNSDPHEVCLIQSEIITRGCVQQVLGRSENKNISSSLSETTLFLSQRFPLVMTVPVSCLLYFNNTNKILYISTFSNFEHARVHACIFEIQEKQRFVSNIFRNSAYLACAVVCWQDFIIISHCLILSTYLIVQ